MLRATRWVAGLCGASIAHLAVFWAVGLVALERADKTPTEAQTTIIEYLDAASVDQQMTLFDPRPLLVPTRWNVANAENVGEIVQEERDIFDDYSPAFQSALGDFIGRYGNPLGQSVSAIGAGRLPWSDVSFQGMCVEEGALAQAQSDELEMLIVNPATGEVVLGESMSVQEAASLADSWPDWRPVTFLATVDQSFLVGGMSVLNSSGYEEVDERLKQLAADRMIPRGRLPDGPYLIEVGP